MDSFDDIVKPTLVLDEACARRNIASMAEKARRQGIRFRPHFKTHQSAGIGEWFRDEGVSRITVSSVEMAAYFAGHSWDDITIAFPANLRQMDELSDLAERVRLGLLVESVESVDALRKGLSEKAAAWIKIDAGAGRTGIPWERTEAVAEVLDAIRSSPNLEARGLLTHAGQTYRAGSRAEIEQIYNETRQRLQKIRDALVETQHLASLRDAQLQISVGDTPGCSVADDLSGVDEIRPGNFVFYDAEQYLLGSCRWEDVAVAVACPVVALHPERGEAVVYGGAIHLSKDFVDYQDQSDPRRTPTIASGPDILRLYGLVALPEDERWGAPIEGAYVKALSQEHGVIHLPAPVFDKIRVGDLLFVIPAHSCLTVTALGRYRTLTGEMISTMNVESGFAL